MYPTLINFFRRRLVQLNPTELEKEEKWARKQLVEPDQREHILITLIYFKLEI